MRPARSTVKFLIADDHSLFVEGLRLMLAGAYPDATVVEAHDGLQAWREIDRKTDFDLVVADMDMPALNGLEFLDRLDRGGILTPAVIVSGSDDPGDVARALDAGALGYIPKHVSPEVLLNGIAQVLDGNLYVPATLAREVTAWRRTQLAGGSASDLSPRQHDVLRLMREGLANRDIAGRLHIAEATVKSHVAALLQLTGAPNRTACVAAALERGLIR